MTTRPMWNEINCTTGEVIERPFTDEEMAQHEENVANLEKLKAEQAEETTRIATLKASAKAKLIAGTPLTEEEAAAIVL
jgi:hypothetical protein